MGNEAVLHPRGPLPASVYWRRRLVTLGIAFLVAVVAWRACGAGGAPTVQVSQSPSPPVSSAPSPSSVSPSPSPTASPTPAPGGPCRTTDLVVNARADAQAYPGGRRPVLTISLTNRGAAPCTYDVGQANREIRVFSGNDRVWSSDDCSPGGAHEVVTLASGKPAAFSVTWSRKRSAPGCPSGTREAVPGTYRVIGRFGDITSQPDTFSLG